MTGSFENTGENRNFSDFESICFLTACCSEEPQISTVFACMILASSLTFSVICFRSWRKAREIWPRTRSLLFDVFRTQCKSLVIFHHILHRYIVYNAFVRSYHVTSHCTFVQVLISLFPSCPLSLVWPVRHHASINLHR